MFGLKTDVWVGALLRRAAAGGGFATVARRGDEDRGDAVVKVVSASGAAVYGRAFDPDAPEPIFVRLPEHAPATDEAAVDAYLARRIEADTDLWIIEIEDRDGRHFLTERIRPAADWPF